MNDSLGDRMKKYYEDRTRFYIPRRTNTIIRLDGRTFHNYCKGLKKPYDELFMDIMDTVGLLMTRLQGCKLAYVQSDEISLLLTDYDDIKTDALFDGNIQKIVSTVASECTELFNKFARERLKKEGANFDCRVFSIPEQEEVINYFIWRQKDWTRNSLSLLAQSHFSHKELQGKSQADMHEMLHSKGVNWANQSERIKNGCLWILEEEVLEEKDGFKLTDNGWYMSNKVITDDRAIIRKVFP